jgi:hypothetical protein
MAPCPKCATLLTTNVIDDGGGMLAATTVLACDGCGGIWLDNEMTQQLVKGILARRVFVVALEGEAARGSTSAHPYREVPTGGCPACREPMTRVRTTRARHGIDGLELDICTAHGTWFDAEELVTLDDALIEKKMDAWEKSVRREAELNAAVEAVYPQGLRTIAVALAGTTKNTLSGR